MSRGPGRVQRNILAYLESHDGKGELAAIVAEFDSDAVDLIAVRGDQKFYSIRERNTYESYRRAMRSLEADEMVTVNHWNRGWRFQISVAVRGSSS